MFYCIVLNKKPRRSHCALIVRFHCALSLCVRCACSLCVLRCACCALCAARCAQHCAHSLCAAVVHNVKPTFLHNEAAQCKTVVRSAWHNGLARVSEAIPAWHNGFGIVRIFFDGICFQYNTVYVIPFLISCLLIYLPLKMF